MAVSTRTSLSSALYFPIKTLPSFSLVSCFKIPFNFPKIPSLKSILNLPKIPFLTYFPDSWTSDSSDFGEFLGRLLEGPKDRFLWWRLGSGPGVDDPKGGIAGEESEVAVVILGWLGAEHHHLRSYVEMYNAKGIHAVTFVPSMVEVLADSNYKMRNLAAELGLWLLKEDGRKRFLLFHTFSNTGWFGYGAILHLWKYEQDLLEKIKGCVVDSGGYPNIEAKVWAAGFTMAVLKECSFVNDPSIEIEIGEEVQNEPETEEKEPRSESKLALLALEEMLSVILNHDCAKARLCEILTGLLMYQPSCPQLFLYSTADKAVPFREVESFMETQRRTGKQVFSFNFESSRHVDHFRRFPCAYFSQLHKFLGRCFIIEGLKQG